MTQFTTDLEPWEKEIVDKYPLIYREPSPQLRTWYDEESFNKLIKDPNFSNLRYGFEFGSGWAKLVDEFSNISQQLVLYLRSNGIQSDAYIHSCIFKEKFGRLTWQGDNNLIEPFKTLFRSYEIHIENKSTTICEISGEDGCLCSRGHWYKTLSYTEARKRGSYQPVNIRDLDTWSYRDVRAKETENNG